MIMVLETCRVLKSIQETVEYVGSYRAFEKPQKNAFNLYIFTRKN